MKHNTLALVMKVINIFKLSQEKKKFNIEQLQSNLEKLIEEAYSKKDAVTAATANVNCKDTSLQTGKWVNHYFSENDKHTFHRGYIISTVPGFNQWFNIVYDNDDNVYTYKLLDDYSNGDLEIIVL